MAARCEKELVEFTVGLGGTITAEHGIGLWKSHLVPLEHPTSLLLMRRIKKALDPKGIMNPGKYNIDFLPEVVQAENWFKEEK
jgi:FAD/FMN-containing dehydrogenase